MGRRKRNPLPAGGLLHNVNVSNSSVVATNVENVQDVDAVEEKTVPSKSFSIDVHQSNWSSDEHFDIADIVLVNVNYNEELIQNNIVDPSTRHSLRLRMDGVEEGSLRLGHWPVISADAIFLEYRVTDISSDVQGHAVLCYGNFDGHDDCVSALAHLVSLKFITLRPFMEAGFGIPSPSFRVRVEVQKSAFEACKSLMEIVRQPWKKSMLKAMSWLRPEVTSSEMIYGVSVSELEKSDICLESTNPIKHFEFDAGAFYEAIMPSKKEPSLDDELPDLLPRLRPYQRRAAYWMIQREKRSMLSSKKSLCRPLCVPVTFIESNSRMFYNPVNGSISLHPDLSSSYVFGGILADEMGLGKTVELLACIFAHPKTSMESGLISSGDVLEDDRQIKRPKRERVECVCGAASESYKYKGLWVQCDVCDAWQHANCVGYSSKKNAITHDKSIRKRAAVENLSFKSSKKKRKRANVNIKEMDGSYVCSLCLELREAANSDISTGATLIVCPSPILSQWHSEIIRHTKPGSLKVFVYEGARGLDSSRSFRTGMHEFATADIVLTTYDVLKEDLSHDSDRHEGDRRFMRFQKRYPVVPTLLTRVHWWRLCLDEAQMVECNTASVTEMAMRLRACYRWCITGTPIQRKLDDLYGLVRFLRASPFDNYKVWAEVIRYPYEKRDAVAMQFVHDFFREIMWRSSKAHVTDELELPPQEESVSWLSFSPVEEHFYQKQHESCMECAHSIIGHIRNVISKETSSSGSDTSSGSILPHNDIAKLLYPLLKLRQACCHPQVGSSGLCSLQQSPLTMEEILEVLMGKAKTEGEEALRRIVVALNGLAAIAIIEQDVERAVVLYKEALALADEVSDDFRLDPLLNIHICYNLAEMLKGAFEISRGCPVENSDVTENGKYSNERMPTDDSFIQHKQCKISKDKLSLSENGHSTEGSNDLDVCASPEHLIHAGKKNWSECDAYDRPPSKNYSDGCLRKKCEDTKQKFLSLFISKLSSSQKEFKTMHEQVCNMIKEHERCNSVWWLDALNLIEQSKQSSAELITKIDETFSKVSTSSRPSRNSSRFQNISGLKYTIQSGLDSLRTAREMLFKQILEIDQIMVNPKDDDMERVRYCSMCTEFDGPLCIHCEMSDLFKSYEARLFLLRKGHDCAIIASVEEALDFQKQMFELNRISKRSTVGSNDIGKKNNVRHARTNVQGLQVSRNSSELELFLGIIKSYTKTKIGRQGVTSAKQHLLLFEAMRKEYALSRCLCLAQGQMLCAYDEIRMATTRLRLKEAEDEPTSNFVLSTEELIPSSLQFSSDKFLASSLLDRIKGQLRYLQGLVMIKHNIKEESSNSFSNVEDKDNVGAYARDGNKYPSKIIHEVCPICHEKLSSQKMVFQCGHVVCCKCCVQMSEQEALCMVSGPKKWIMCPTCRQHTDLQNIAYAVDNNDKISGMSLINTSQNQNKSENMIVQGSYGTKIEAIMRRILWINSQDEDAKILVFSSWNDVLDVLEHALLANKITYVRMKGARKSQVALARFKGQGHSLLEGLKKRKQPSAPKHIQVLLMLIQHGANGLNILEAQHVILTEPLLNPAVEEQATSRVHRIGQSKKTFVHRFLIKKTVEESIYTLNRSRNRTLHSFATVKTNHRDRPSLTLRDVESLFSQPAPPQLGKETDNVCSLSYLPPAVAAGLAAERRLMISDANARST